MQHKWKLLFLLIPIFLLTSCGEGGDSIFSSLDFEGQMVYLAIVVGLGIIGLVLRLVFRIIRGKKQPGASSRPQEQPQQQPQVQPQQQVLPHQQIQQQQPTSSTMPPPPSVDMITELSKTESQNETA